MIPIQAALVSYDELVKQGEQLKQALEGLETTQQDLTTTRDKAGELKVAFEQALREKEEMRKERDKANETIEGNQHIISSHVATILRLQEQIKPPPLIPRKPIITKTEMRDVAGVAIPKGNAPSAAQDQNARKMMLMASLMGFNAWRGFFNLNEVKAHAAMLENNPNHLTGYGRRLGLTFFADTLNNPAINYSDPDLKIYMEGLRKMAGAGPFIGYFDDANQYLNETKYPKGTLERLVGRIRQFAPDIILVASLTAGADIGTYKRPGLFDFVEAQTFGKIGELGGMLGKGFDVYCLDGRKEISIDYLTQAIEIVASKNPRNVFYYVTAITDWETIAEKLPIIKQTVTRWMSMAR